MNKQTLGVFIGRFQPFHLGHLSAIKQTLTKVDQLVVVIGSANQNFDIKNPLLAKERLQLIELVKNNQKELKTKISNVLFLDDQINNLLWLQQLLQTVPNINLISSNNALVKILAEYMKLPIFTPKLEKRDQFRGEIIRNLILENKQWHQEVPACLVNYLEEIDIKHRLQSLIKKDF